MATDLQTAPAVSTLPAIPATDDIGFDRELLMMSFQNGEPVRRIRARMAKSGMIENLEAQLRERKAVDFILEKASFVDVPRKPMVKNDQASVRFAICGNMGSSLIDDTQFFEFCFGRHNI